MRQYAQFKAAHPGCLLFFRIGDFYELFDDDAVTVHRALGLTLTQRTEGVPMAGVPFHAVEGYLRRLIDQGFRVAVCEQMEDAAQAKGVIRRDVTRVLTPGTLVDESLLDESRSNLLGAIVLSGEGDATAGCLALAEVSTGSFTLHRLPAGRVLDELARLAPNELLVADESSSVEQHPLIAEHASRHGCAITTRPGWTFRPRDAARLLREAFGVSSLNGFGLDDGDPLVAPAGAVVRYLQETQGETQGATAGGTSAAAQAQRGPRRSPLRPPRLIEQRSHLLIDATSLRTLEIERTLRSGGTEGSLLAMMERPRTAMGKRLLRHWLCAPLAERAAIEARQRMVGALVADGECARSLSTLLGAVQDVARIAGRAALGRATPRDVVALGRSVSGLAALLELLDRRPAFSSLREQLAAGHETLTPLASRIAKECVEEPPPHLREGGLFRDGVDAALDESRRLQRDAGSWLSEYQRTLIDQTAIPSLKVAFNRVFGYYIEVTNAHSAKVPASFVRRQTLRGAERYITPELKSHEDRVLSAESRAIEREKDLFESLCAVISDAAGFLAAFAEAVGTLDVLAALAEHARRHRCVRPRIVEEPVLRVIQGRHPVLDRMLGTAFIPNDCLLRWTPHAQPPVAGASDPADGAPSELAEGEQEVQASLALITGPNMAGKSTFIRQVALLVLLAHVGAFVPAEEAVIGLCDRIFTRIGASDELHAGQSTFMVEMTETANILHHATARSLVVLDEIGRGTSTLDGLSLAWAIAETLADRGARTLFATHYHELTGLADRQRSVTNLQVAVREWGDEIVFLHRIEPGRTDRSYGIHVARLAGLPASTLARAEELLDTLAVQTQPQAIDRAPTLAPRDGQLSLFTEYLPHPAIDRLRSLSIDRMTPLEAFDLLRGLVAQAAGRTQPNLPATEEKRRSGSDAEC
jgi:DNA mismatch repair protein MutS